MSAPIGFTGIPPNADHLIPGSFFLRRIPGWTGRWVSAAQAFVRGGSNWTHAGIVLDDEEIIEAMPGGARIRDASTLWSAGEVAISDAPVQRWAAKQIWPQVLFAEEMGIATKRAEIVGKARYLEGVPYSFLDYGALALAEWKVPGWKLVRDRVENSQHLICSALVDRAYAWCDVHLFDDGRLPGDVTPWDLEQYVLKAEGARLARIASEAKSW